MSEKPTPQPNAAPTPESIQAQEFKLLDIQADHTDRLGQAGILDKVFHKVYVDEETEGVRIPEQEQFLSSAVCKIRSPQDDGTVIEKPSIRLTNTVMGTNGNSSQSHTYVPVGEMFGGIGLALPGFEDEDLATVNEMLEELDELRASGQLSHLSPDNATILNPFTAITKLPPTEQQ